MTIKRILVPIDFSHNSDVALQYAVQLAQPLGASVHLLHVVENPLAAGMWSSSVYTSEVPGLQVDVVRDAEHRLAQMIPTIAGVRYGLDHTVRIGPAPETIVDFASDELADLIVMGTHGRTGLGHALIGSVAEQVVRRAPCPVLTLRADRTDKPKAHKTRAALVI
jgi:nucleotide-binding universal stress UspA family protein